MSSCPILSSRDSLASVVSTHGPLACGPGAAAEPRPPEPALARDPGAPDGSDPDPDVAIQTTPAPSATITAAPTASQRSGIQLSGAGRRLLAMCRPAVRGTSSTIDHRIQ